MPNITEEKLLMSIDDQTSESINAIKGRIGALRASANDLGESFRRNEKIILASITAIGVGGAAVVLRLTSQFAETADAAGKMAFRIGANVEGLTALQFVAQKSSVSVEALNIGLQRQVRRTAEAAQGTGEAANAIKELGLEAEELNKLKADEQFMLYAKALEQVEGDADRVRIAMKLWDSEGVALLQTLQDGTAGIEDMRREAQRLGVVIDDDAAAAAKRFEDNLTSLKAVLPGFGNLIGSELVGPFADLVGLIKDIASSDNFITRFVQNWAVGAGIIVENWSAGARQIIGVQEQIIQKSNEIRDTSIGAGASGGQEELKKQADINEMLAELRMRNELAEMDDLQRRLFQIDEFYAAKVEKLIANNATEYEIAQAENLRNEEVRRVQAEELLKREKIESDKRIKLAANENKARENLERQRIGNAAGLADVLFQLSDRKNRDLFNLHKGLAIASATVDAYRASAAALANPPGPPFTLGTAALALAKGLLQVRSISSTTLNTGGGGAGVGAFGGGFGDFGGAGAAPPAPQAPSGPEGFITVRIITDSPKKGDLIEDVKTQLVDEINDGRLVFTTEKG